MKSEKIKLFVVLSVMMAFSFQGMFSQSVVEPSVKISDHRGYDGDTINIGCLGYDYFEGNRIRLTATYPNIRQPTSYAVSQIGYDPFGEFSDGDTVETYTMQNGAPKEDDTFSNLISIGFKFCFYGNTYDKLVISDNGIVSFYEDNEHEEAPRGPVNPIPTGLPKNSIFGVFHDMDNIGVNEIRCYMTGTAPYRKFIINYNKIPEFGYKIPGKESTSQIVLYETSNIIDVYVKDRYQNLGDNVDFPNAVIGLTNIDSSLGIVAKDDITGTDRNTGNWEAHDEAWRFTPAGNLSLITVRWFKEAGLSPVSTSTTSPHYLVPLGQEDDTYYRAEVTYSLCSPLMTSTVKDTIYIDFSQEFPTVKNITTDAFCVDDEKEIDLTQYQNEINPDESLEFTYYENNTFTTPIIGGNPKEYVYSANKTIYVKVSKGGSCYRTAQINLRLNKRPKVSSKVLAIKICDTESEGDWKERINFNTTILTTTNFNGWGSGLSWKLYTTYDDATSGNNEITGPFTNFLLDVSSVSSRTKTFYMRVWNTSLNDTGCYSIVEFSIQLIDKIILKPVKELVCNGVEGEQESRDLTQYANELIESPTTGVTLKYYRNSSNCTNEITSPGNASMIIGTPICVVASIGSCQAKTTITLLPDADCNDEEDDDGGGGGGGGGGGPAAPGGPAGPMCDVQEDIITKKLDEDYLEYYLEYIYSLHLSDVDIIGFYSNAACTSLITNTSPYEHTFSPPYSQTIWAKFTITKSGSSQGQVKTIMFTIYASKQVGDKNLGAFDICDVGNDGKENNVIIKSTSATIPKPKWQELLENSYPGAAIYFFKTEEDLNAFKANPDDPVNISKIITSLNIDTNVNPPPTKVWVYVKYLECTYTHYFNINLVPIQVKPFEYTVCDFGADEKEIVDLTKTEYTQGYEDYIANELLIPSTLIDRIRYYKTEGAAHAGGTHLTPAQLQSFQLDGNVLSEQMEVYIRVDYKSSVEKCYTIFKLEFEFTTSVALPIITDPLYVCDTDDSGKDAEFVDMRSLISSPDEDSVISFYTSKEGAETENPGYYLGQYNPTNPVLYEVVLVPPYTTATVYIRVDDTNTHCWKVIPATISLIKIPEITNYEVKICDLGGDDKEEISMAYVKSQLIANNNPGIDSSMDYYFFDNEIDAKDLSNTISLTTFTIDTNHKKIYVRVEQENGGCYDVSEVNFTLIPPPSYNILEPIYICSNNTKNENPNAVSEILKLSDYVDLLVEGYGDLSDYSFTYYNNPDNANAGTGAILQEQLITGFPDDNSITFYVRVKYNPTGCFSVAPLTFKPYEDLKDRVKDGNIIFCTAGEQNGIIDLTEYPPLMVVDSDDLSNFIITYHTEKAVAISSNVSTIDGDLTNYNVNDKTSIWIKFVDNTTKCYILKKLGITIYLNPKVASVVTQICDESDGKLDGQYVIPDLDIHKKDISNEPNANDLYTFTYFRSQYDAQLNKVENAIEPVNFTFNQSDVTTGTPPALDSYKVWVRIGKKDGTHCYSLISITFLINPKVPIEDEVPEILECDENDDGYTEFDLTSVKD
ncbi:MAG: hypothetical protein LBQ84_08495, partial [Flavobacteriaceae bacterium]|nr:hypothetical protein [Flavobacteriaceae bacterium]